MQEKNSYLVRTRYDFFSCMSLRGLRRYLLISVNVGEITDVYF